MVVGWRPSLLNWRPSLLGWRPSPAGWGPSLLGWRPSLLGWRPSLVGWRPWLLGVRGLPPAVWRPTPLQLLNGSWSKALALANWISHLGSTRIVWGPQEGFFAVWSDLEGKTVVGPNEHIHEYAKVSCSPCSLLCSLCF